MTAPGFYPGQRLSYDKQLCTVRFVGELAGTKGQWLGVEWDDAVRGKHDGQHNGQRYFTCQSKTSSPASFVRPSRPHDPPISFTDAVRQKYAYDDDAEGAPVFISGKEAEEVGFEKIRMQMANLKSLRVVIVDDLCVHRPLAGAQRTQPTASDVRDTCPRITDLDLSRNLLEDWDEVLDIVRQLPSLQALKAEGNRFRSMSCSLDQHVLSQPPFTRLQTLSLDDTLLAWSDVAKAASCFPNLTSLSASGNEYTSLSPALLPQTITSLSLERNGFTSLDDLAPLAKMLNLQRLTLKSNAISSPASTITFPASLSTLDLSYNAITSFQFIDALGAAWPGLTSLRIAHNPLFDSLAAPDDGRALSADDGYMLTLARLAGLTTLNFSKIAAKERLNAETYYLSLVAKQIAAQPTRADAIRAENPRFAELCQLHGDPMVKVESVAVNERTLAAKLVRLRVRVGEGVGGCAGQDVEIEVPKSLSVYATLGLVGRRLGCAPMLLRLVWETGETLAGDAGCREETLVPRSRQLGSWFDGRDAAVRVEWSEQQVLWKQKCAENVGVKV